MSNPNQIICPNCTHQFRAIPLDVQAEIERLRLIWDEWDDQCRTECSSDVHEDDCPAVVLVNALKDRRQRAEKAEAEIERLRSLKSS